MSQAQQPTLFDEHESQFHAFHNANPHVYEIWEQLTFKAIGRGYQHIGAALIRELIRWETGITTTDSKYKIPNQFTPHYARLFMRQHPEHQGFFRTKTSVADDDPSIN